MSQATSMVIKCANCGANNRVQVGGSANKQPVCGRCKSPLSPAATEPVTVTDANFASIVESSDLPVLLDMWADWCGPCRMIAPTIKKLASELSGKVLVGKLDVDSNPRTAARFNVRSIPTLLIIKGGQEAVRLVGVQTREAILERLGSVA